MMTWLCMYRCGVKTYLYKYMHRHAGEVLEVTCSGKFFLIMTLVVWLFLKIHCCILYTALWICPGPTHHPTDTCLGQAVAGEGCLHTSQPGNIACRTLCSVHVTGVGMGWEAWSFQVQLLINDHNTSSRIEPHTSKMLCGCLDGSSLWAGNEWEGVRRQGTLVSAGPRTGPWWVSLVLFGFT